MSDVWLGRIFELLAFSLHALRNWIKCPNFWLFGLLVSDEDIGCRVVAIRLRYTLSDRQSARPL